MTGVPVVINTSFNVRGEPIVCTPEDAYRTFVNTGFDAVVMGDFIVTEKPCGGGLSTRACAAAWSWRRTPARRWTP